jgi:hypothetical protein
MSKHRNGGGEEDESIIFLPIYLLSIDETDNIFIYVQ